MFYKKFAPSAFLKPYVECFYVWESSVRLTSGILVESPPSGYTSMVFNYGDTYKAVNEKYDLRAVPAAFVSGQATKSYQLQIAGKIGMIGVVFKPAALYTLFGIPMYEMSDERIDLTDLLGNEGTVLYARILEEPDILTRIGLLESFLTRKVLQCKTGFDRTDFVSNLILEKNGVISITELMDELYVCQRQFQRHFLKKVGLSPKHFARTQPDEQSVRAHGKEAVENQRLAWPHTSIRIL